MCDVIGGHGPAGPFVGPALEGIAFGIHHGLSPGEPGAAVDTRPIPAFSLARRSPSPDEPIGTERARELIAALQLIAGPVVDAAEADLQARTANDIEIVRSGAPASYLARVMFGPDMRTVCVGTVYQTRTGDPDQNSLQLDRDGVLHWRRG